MTPGPRQSRLKPGVAIAIVRECLAALAALHRVNILSLVWICGNEAATEIHQKFVATDFTRKNLRQSMSERWFESAYSAAMERIARVSAQVAQIQQDNLLDVQNFVEQRQIRIMEMEWIERFASSRS